eukprot:1477264-Amphidinium_carterae.1
MSVDETQGCDHCRRHHVNLNVCTCAGCLRQQCNTHDYGESPFEEVCLTCNLTQFVMRQGDFQDSNLPCAWLCRLIDEPLSTDLRNQVLTGVRC